MSSDLVGRGDHRRHQEDRQGCQRGGRAERPFIAAVQEVARGGGTGEGHEHDGRQGLADADEDLVVALLAGTFPGSLAGGRHRLLGLRLAAQTTACLRRRRRGRLQRRGFGHRVLVDDGEHDRLGGRLRFGDRGELEGVSAGPGRHHGVGLGGQREGRGGGVRREGGGRGGSLGRGLEQLGCGRLGRRDREREPMRLGRLGLGVRRRRGRYRPAGHLRGGLCGRLNGRLGDSVSFRRLFGRGLFGAGCSGAGCSDAGWAMGASGVQSVGTAARLFPPVGATAGVTASGAIGSEMAVSATGSNASGT